MIIKQLIEIFIYMIYLTMGVNYLFNYSTLYYKYYLCSVKGDKNGITDIFGVFY